MGKKRKKRFGPDTKRVRRIMEEMHMLNSERVQKILEVHKVVGIDAVAMHRAWKSAHQAGLSREVAYAAEEVRRYMWAIPIDTTWEETWTLSWIASRAAVAATTFSLVGSGDYGPEDYTVLAGVWASGNFDEEEGT